MSYREILRIRKLKREVVSWLGKTAKVIIYFSFLFLSGLTTQGWSMRKYHITKCHRVTGLWVTVRWCHMTKSHGNCGKIVHRPYSSCISSIGNLTETPLSSPCQLRLEVVLRCLSLSPYSTLSHVLPECFVITWPCHVTLVPTLFISSTLLYVLRFWIKCSNAWETFLFLGLS